MVRERADWCISRQRKWGVPIPVLYCKHCGKEIIDNDIMMKVSEIFGKEGSDAWFAHDAEYFLPEGFKCPHCGENEGFDKESDIMDVWFDSGSSHQAVLAKRPYLARPADVYLEGADQYRGWFQSSLLTSVAQGLGAPFKQIITHGWTVDGEGKKCLNPFETALLRRISFKNTVQIFFAFGLLLRIIMQISESAPKS